MTEGQKNEAELVAPRPHYHLFPFFVPRYPPPQLGSSSAASRSFEEEGAPNVAISRVFSHLFFPEEDDPKDDRAVKTMQLFSFLFPSLENTEVPFEEREDSVLRELMAEKD